MAGNIGWILRCDIKDGALDAFKTLMEEMVEATKADEPETLNYEWFINADETKCQIYQRYKDSTAIMTHLASFQRKFAERFLAAVTPTGLTVYGDPDDVVRGALSAFNPIYVSQIGGFAR